MNRTFSGYRRTFLGHQEGATVRANEIHIVNAGCGLGCCIQPSYEGGFPWLWTLCGHKPDMGGVCEVYPGLRARKATRHLSPFYHQTAGIHHMHRLARFLACRESTDNRPMFQRNRPTKAAGAQSNQDRK